MFLRLVIAGLLAVGGATFGWSAASEADLSSQESTQGVVKYVCPMHPQIVRDHPGTCPICGMTLVKKLFKSEAGAPSVKLSGGGGTGEKLGLAIRTAKVQRVTLWKYLPTYGVITADESAIVHVHPRTSGWITHLAVRTTGETVQKGQLLFTYYAPDIVAAQEEWLLALRQKQSRLAKAAERKLRYLGVDRDTLRQIRKRGRVMESVPVYASTNGVVQMLNAQDGMYVTPTSEVIQLVDVSRVWVIASVYPQQQQWVAEGKTLEVRVPGISERYWEGAVERIYPDIDPVSKTLKVRSTLPNQDGLLKLGMPVKAIIYGGPKHNVLAVPESALIEMPDEVRVVKVLSDGGFKPVEVVVGMRTRGVAEILSGLNEGDEIVISGQFLIDSESQIKANLTKLAAPAHQHGGHGQ